MWKQRLLFFCVMLALLFLPTSLLADTTESSAKAGASLDYHPYYEGSVDKRGFIGVGNIGPYIIPPAVYYSDEDGEWVVWESPFPIITIQMLKSMRMGWWERRKLVKDITGWAAFEKNNSDIVSLRWYPQNVLPIVYIKIFNAPEAKNIESIIYTALYEAKKESQGIYFLVLINRKLVSINEVKTSGIAGLLSKMLGSSGKTDDIIGTGALSAGGGKGQAWGEKQPTIKIIGFDRFGPPVVQKQEEPDGIDEQEKIKSEISISDIYFNFDEFDIVGQKEQLEKIAQYVQNNPEQIFWIIGSCDIRGNDKYNDSLGMDRGKTVATEIAKILSDNGMSMEEIQRRVRYVSEGKRHPDFTKHANNRRVYIVSGEKVTQAETTIPNLEIDK